MSKELPDSLNELFPQIANMSEKEKMLKVARYMPCDQCDDCHGWRPNFSLDYAQDTTCLCGHEPDDHVDHKKDFVRRFKVALRIDELLEEKEKIDDYDYTDDDIESLKKQITYDSSSAQAAINFMSKASASSFSIEEDDRTTKRHRDGSDDEELDKSKRFKLDDDESEDEEKIDNHEEEEDEEEEEEEEEEDEEEPYEETEEEEDEDEEDDDEEEEDEDEEEDEEEDNTDFEDEKEKHDEDESDVFEDAEEDITHIDLDTASYPTNENQANKTLPGENLEENSSDAPILLESSNENNAKDAHDKDESTTVTDDKNQSNTMDTNIGGNENENKPNTSTDIPERTMNGQQQTRQKMEVDNGEEEIQEKPSETKSDQDLLSENLPKIKSEPEEVDRLLNEEALTVNGALNATEGILDGNGNVKILDDFKPLEKKETPAMIEERTGLIEVRVVENDGTRENMILLTGLKNIFQKQLPKMPKEYIARLVYDRNHKSIALIRKPMKVIGGICFRPFNPQEFAEIVFCAIASTEQVKGYGSFLMNHLKDYVSSHTNMKHYLTYADNYATGYFKKQGFTTEITLDKRKWVGYIKDYEGGTIMQCTTVPKVKYLQVHELLAIQKKAVYEKMKEFSTSHIVYPGIQMPKNEEGIRCIDPYKVLGVKESGWTPEMDALSNRPRHPPHYNQMRHLVSELRAHPHSWPFHEPVNADEVADYYEVIAEPMDLNTLEENVESDAYQTMDEFIRDVQKIFDNCRFYNAEGTNYARCANRLERYFNERLRVWTNNGDDTATT